MCFVIGISPSLAEQNGNQVLVAPADWGIQGVWSGVDALGSITVTITQDGSFTISHPGCDLLDEIGTYIADISSITVTFDNDAVQVFRYLLSADTMLLADETLQYPVILTRHTQM